MQAHFFFIPFLYISGPIFLTINTITYICCAWNCNPGKFDIIFSDTAAEPHKFTQGNTLFQQHIHTQSQPILLIFDTSTKVVLILATTAVGNTHNNN